MANKGSFKKGQDARRGKGGARPGAGRKPDWLAEQARKAFDDAAVIKFYVDVILGKDIDQCINENGECLKVPADVKQRIHAGELLKEWGFGSKLEIGMTDGAGGVVILAAQDIGKRGEVRDAS